MHETTSIPLNSLHSPETSRFLVDEHRSTPPHSPHDIGDIFQNPKSVDDELLASVHPAWRKGLFSLMELPRSSPGSCLVHVLTTSLIVASAIVTVLETIPEFHSISKRVWFGLETMLVSLFTIEYIARSFAWSTSLGSYFGWATSFFGVIDLLAILPYYIEIILQEDTSVLFRFSILRMFRLLRVFRPFRYNNTILLTIEVMYLSVRRSQHALLAISFFVVMILTVFSTLLYFAERGTWDDALDIFINVDGDPTQFPVYILSSPLTCSSHCLCSLYLLLLGSFSLR
jgi:potassium voltage-gated channel Shal-related subfamily D protein 2